MAKYVDIDREINGLKCALGKGKHSELAHLAVESFIEALQKAPTADVVEVVRCKDCRYGTIAYGCLKRGKGLRGDFVKPNDFCSYGERRDTE